MLAELATEKRIPLSIASIKRAEAGRPVSLRTSLQFSILFGVPVKDLHLKEIEPLLTNCHKKNACVIYTDDVPYPLAGRRNAIIRLRQELAEFELSARPWFVYLHGETGFGKSRFISHVLGESEREKCKVWNVKIFQKSNRETYSILKLIIFALLDIDPLSNTTEKTLTASRIRSSGIKKHHQEILESILWAADIQSKCETKIQKHKEQYSEGIKNALSDLIIMANRGRRSIFLIEDLHYADSEFFSFFGELISVTKNVPVFWIVTERQGSHCLATVVSNLPANYKKTIIDLDPLARNDAQRLEFSI